MNVERLVWDSEFFGFPIARVTRLDGGVLDWAAREKIRCLYFLAACDDIDSVRAAEQNGFHLVDIRVTFTRRLSADPIPVGPFRLAVASDIPVLREIARGSYVDSRFFADPGFPRDKCDELYQTWIEKSCKGFAAAVLVADVDGQPAGFVTCDRHADGRGQIGLVGIGAQARGKGLGSQLMQQSLRWFQAAGISEVDVVTQGRNLAAQRLYQRAGFTTSAVQLWYHRWF